MKGARIPLAAWVIAGVVGVHLLAFWFWADKHFLPKVRRVAPRPPANFSAGERAAGIDPATGEPVVERDYVVSTQLRQPPPSVTPPAARR